ncbi:MAG TPA: DHA2 family efflux MFS transporter permease subunit [Stellaceae bacterium]|nr:DHA2 family efflux MFS transporter permease subunit [Stellaceae bacterium]
MIDVGHGCLDGTLEEGELYRRTPVKAWVGFFALCVGMFMAVLDIQIVASSLPDIQAGLHIPADDLAWVQTAYLIAEVVAIMLSGWLTPALSTGGLFTLSVVFFTLASLGCAGAHSFAGLIFFRVVQGFFGGAIIPTAFTAGYRIFPIRLQPRATLVAGSLAVLAPTIGPCLGGYITENYDWPWLFWINLLPGILVSLTTWFTVHIDRPDPRRWRHIDFVSAMLLAVALASFEIVLTRAPIIGWTHPRTLFLVALCGLTAVWGVRRCLADPDPLVNFRIFRRRHFSIACALTFIFGTALYGTVYLMPLFLGYVRHHTALETGMIMTVMGVAQLLSAPAAAYAERRFSCLLVTGVGFALYGVGLIANGFETPATDAAQLFWPQVLRGLAVLICLIPVTNAALRGHDPEHLPQASALINLIRNLGGAIGISLVDTLINLRPTPIGQGIVRKLMAGDRATAAFVGLPLDRFHGVPIGPVSAADQEFGRPLIERAAATIAFNEAWLLLGIAMLLAACLIPFLRRR